MRNAYKLLFGPVFGGILFFQSCLAQQGKDPNMKLWYDKPATIWEEALPLGNGKTGAMVFGGIATERYQLNDLTLWSGSPKDGNNPEGPQILKETREAVNAGDYARAAETWKKIHGPYSARYLPMADLFVRMLLPDSSVTNYYRDLNIANATASVMYNSNGIKYTRETFISHPDKAMIVQITADRKHAISLETWLTSKLHYRITDQNRDYLILRGKAPKYVAHRNYEPEQIVYDPENGEGTNFEVYLKIKAIGGKTRVVNSKVLVEKADRVIIYLAGATSFNGFDKSPGLEGKDPSIEAKDIINKVVTKSYNQLKVNHITDYQNLFNRVSFKLDENAETLKLPTDERMLQFNRGKNDHQLIALYYQFGRYLLISSSRDQQNPANLQGIWNDQVQPPWGSNYTLNINTEMNYWMAETANLPDSHAPLFGYLNSLSVNGTKTARVNFGLDGWCAHHNSDIWAKTSPTGGENWDPRGAPRWSCWVMGGAWLCQDLFRHYEFTGDTTFLREKAWPLMRGAALFLLQWLTKDSSGYLVTNPSSSPENVFRINGITYEVSKATTMDMAITRDLFTNCIRTLGILKTEPEFKNKLSEALKKLYPYHIGQYGQLQEWFLDWDDPADTHRHISHLFGLYPGSQISPRRTPELAAAAKKSLIQRGDVSTGWSMAWKINWWARLEDGDHAYKILKDGLTYIGPKSDSAKGGGTYPNLFDAHPPFQIDGNFGGTAGITEMLLQSYDGVISLLPALPSAWANGEIKGIMARGGFKIDIQWNNGRVSKAVIFSTLGGNCRIRTTIPVKVVESAAINATGINPNSFYLTNPEPVVIKKNRDPLEILPLVREYTIDFNTEKEKTYTLVPQ